jgi:hypothetical protein
MPLKFPAERAAGRDSVPARHLYRDIFILM